MVKFLLKPYVIMALRVLTWIVYLFTIVSAFGGYVPPKIWSLPSVFVLGLPYFTIATIICILGWALSRHLVMTGLGVGVIFLCSVPMLMASPMGSSKKAEPNKPVFTFLTYNITHGEDIRERDKTRSSSIDWVMKQNADIVVLQELSDFTGAEIRHFPASMRDSLLAMYPYRIGYEPDHMSILSKYPVTQTFRQHKEPGMMSMFVGYKVNIRGHQLNIINCHLESYLLTDEERQVVTNLKDPENAGHSIREFKGSILSKLKDAFKRRADQATELRREIDKIEGPLIVCGDFNDVPASWAYRTIMGDDMQDAYRNTNFGPTYTFNRHLFLFHIDQILYRGPIEFLSVKRGSINSSDHYPLTAEFQLE